MSWTVGRLVEFRGGFVEVYRLEYTRRVCGRCYAVSESAIARTSESSPWQDLTTDHALRDGRVRAVDEWYSAPLKFEETAD